MKTHTILILAASLFQASLCAGLQNAFENPNATSAADSNFESLIRLLLYNRNHQDGVRIQPTDTIERLRELFIPNVGLKVCAHGWISNERVNEAMCGPYLATQDVNTMSVDWSELAATGYITAVSRVPKVGEFAGKMLLRIMEAKEADLGKIHLVGHSLGAHVVGVLAGYARDHGPGGLVARVTGLDPASPLYEGVQNESTRLDKGDASFVDIIHSCRGIGYFTSLGHADFYPNGGSCEQPGCPEDAIPSITGYAFCGHFRSVDYFAQTIYNRNLYPAVQCSSYDSYLLGGCGSNEVVPMGEGAPSSARGNYYLKITTAPPNASVNLIV